MIDLSRDFEKGVYILAALVAATAVAASVYLAYFF